MENQEILDAFGTALAKDGVSTATGLVNIDLQAPAKFLVPITTPLRNRIARVKGNGAISTAWRAITNINSTKVHAGVSEGQRGGVVTPIVTNASAFYKTIGLEGRVTDEAIRAAAGFDDANKLSVKGTLMSMMMAEEGIILGGSASVSLGSIGTVTTGVVAGGALTAQTWSVICVPLTMTGFAESSVANGVQLPYTRTNANGTTDTVSGFFGVKSAAVSQATTGGNATLTATVNAVAGAGGYAWYAGLAGSEVLAAITLINSVSLSANPLGTQNASALSTVDKSTDALVFDGLLAQIIASGSGAQVTALSTGTAGVGTKLTSDGAGGIKEIETMLFNFYSNSKSSPDTMYMSAATMISINTLIIANGGAPLIRFNGGMNGDHTISAGAVVGTYLNKVMGTMVKIEVHPNMPTGMILFYSGELPAQYYPQTGVTNTAEIHYRQDYYQELWPRTTRRNEFGVYADETLAMYFMPAFGLLYNIAV